LTYDDGRELRDLEIHERAWRTKVSVVSLQAIACQLDCTKAKDPGMETHARLFVQDGVAWTRRDVSSPRPQLYEPFAELVSKRQSVRIDVGHWRVASFVDDGRDLLWSGDGA